MRHTDVSMPIIELCEKEATLGKSKKTKMAIKKAKRVKTIKVIVFIVVIAIIAAAATYFFLNREDNGNGTDDGNSADVPVVGERVFANADYTVTLGGDGSFEANIFHGLEKNGTYIEESAGDFAVVTFFYDGISAESMRVSNILNIPSEWDDDCGHDLEFILI